MAIYPEKRDGKLTGYYRVELQRTVNGKQERYRRRWTSLKDAEADESAVKAAWAKGAAFDTQGRAPGAPRAAVVHTFASVFPEALPVLWDDKKDRAKCWSRLEAIADILGRDMPLDDVDTPAFGRVALVLKQRGRRDSTVNRYLSHLSTFLTWAFHNKFRSLPVRDQVKIPRKEETRGRFRWITYEEEAELMRLLPDNVAKLVKIAIETGCRRMELLTLKLSNVHGDRLHVWQAKTGKPKSIPITDETKALLLELIEQGTMPTPGELRSAWERARAAMGLEHDKDFVFHACRHTCATRLVEADINLFTIQRWMGHKTIKTTEMYAHVGDKSLDNALIRAGEYHKAELEKALQSSTLRPSPTSPTDGGKARLRAVA